MSPLTLNRSEWAPRLLSLLRIVVGLLFMQHVAQKLFGFPPSNHPSPPLELLSLVGIAGILEFFGGLFILLGLFTRSVAFLLWGVMAVAFFKAHAPNGFWPVSYGGELALL